MATTSFTDVMRNAVTSLEGTFTTNPLIDQATTDDEKPTPFYIYQEIIKLTFQGGATCERLLHHVLTKLSSERPSVKLKALLVMEHLLRKGHPHFQHSLQKEVAKIRPCLDFRGPPDPLHGEQPYRFVREKASVVLNLVYETRTDARYEIDPGQGISSSTPTPQKSAISTQGFGSDSQRGFGSDSSMRGFGSDTSMRGFGSGGMAAPTSGFARGGSSGFGARGPTSIESAYRKPTDNTAVDTVKNFFSNSVATLSKAVTSEPEPLSAPDMGTYRSPVSTLNTPSPSGASFASSVNYGHFGSSHTMAPVESTFPVDAQHEPGTVGGSWAESQPKTAVGGRASAGYEGKIVEEVCNPTGVKLTPTRLQLSQFVQAVRECESPDYVCYLLCENLADNNWKKRLKALHAIHELINNDVVPSKQYFNGDGLPSLVALRVSVQQSVREKAIQILQQIAPDSLKVAAPPQPEEIPGLPSQQANAVKSIFESLDPQQKQLQQFSQLQQQQQAEAAQAQPSIFQVANTTVQVQKQTTPPQASSGFNLLEETPAPTTAATTPSWQPSDSILLTPVAQEQPKAVSAAPQVSFAQSYGAAGTTPAATPTSSSGTGERRSSMSQLAEVFNDGQSKAAIIDMLSHTSQAYPAYPQAYPTTAYTGVYGMPAQGMGMPPTTYGYGQPYGYAATPMTTPGATAGGFAFVSTGQAQKDPFDFGDLSKLASNM